MPQPLMQYTITVSADVDRRIKHMAQLENVGANQWATTALLLWVDRVQQQPHSGKVMREALKDYEQEVFQPHLEPWEREASDG